MGHLIQLSVAAPEQHCTLPLSRRPFPYADNPTHTSETGDCQQGVDAFHHTAQLQLYAVIYDPPERRLQPHGEIAPSADSLGK